MTTNSLLGYPIRTVNGETETMKNSIIEIIKNRRSYRGTYKADKVPKEDLVTIMEAGLSAPSGCNKQTTSLICVDDPDVLGKIRAIKD